ncbi:hypothetical protein ANCCEY_09660 [Ancylostoma ceylanicum]|uniref:Uncharacterized protein n=1 Tax=Ancylostoma ceylanicum TaxID=53326 RepID=A0A0D6LGW7_9BILA|nr:hypothetical protein ANCCEY_09660 [Ancylostoma ceylanicum]
MVSDAKPRSAEQIDAAVQAYLPEHDANNVLFAIVTRNMIHKRCDALYHAWRMGNAPKGFQMTSGKRLMSMLKDIKYKRPDNRRTYVYKEPDRASPQNVWCQISEILSYLDARYVCASEAVHHIFMFDCQFMFDTVHRLQVHLQYFQTVTFLADGEREALEAAAAKAIALTAWLKLNEEYERKEEEGVDLQGVVDPRTLHCTQIQEFFTFVEQTGRWKIR